MVERALELYVTRGNHRLPLINVRRVIIVKKISQRLLWFWIVMGILLYGRPGNLIAQADVSDYLSDIKTELKKEWPGNRTINLVFHGHSVPAGYFVTPVVNTPDSYPWQLLAELKVLYPYAVINVINTAIGGENSLSGAKRFKKDVLTHNPDVLFIDYALNDRSIGLENARKAWESMIRCALKRKIKIILLTPSPDQNLNLLDSGNVLEMNAKQIRSLAAKYSIGLADSYHAFKRMVASGNPLPGYMSQVNHPNKSGHRLIVQEILPYFK